MEPLKNKNFVDTKIREDNMVLLFRKIFFVTLYLWFNECCWKIRRDATFAALLHLWESTLFGF